MLSYDSLYRVFSQSLNDSSKFTKLWDDSDPTNIYIGEANPGTLTSSAHWRIYKVSSNGLNFASGSAAFSSIWDNRTGYTYS